MSDQKPSPETLLAAALEISGAAERRAYLDRACGGDAELRQEVESLLEADAAAGEFLLHPAAVAAGAAPKKHIPMCSNHFMRWQPFLTAAAAALVLAACYTARRDAPTSPVTAQEAETEKPPGVGAARITWGPERDPEIRRLLKERFEAAVNSHGAEGKKLANGRSTTDSLLGTSRVLAEAEVELAETPEQVFAAWESEVRRCTEMVAENNRRIEVGTLAPQEDCLVHAGCAAAEIDLLRARRQFQQDQRDWGAPLARRHQLLHFFLQPWRLSVTWNFGGCSKSVTTRSQWGIRLRKRSSRVENPRSK